MDTGRNELNAEMLEKIHEVFKQDAFNEFAKDIISDKAYSTDTPITPLKWGISDETRKHIKDTLEGYGGIVDMFREKSIDAETVHVTGDRSLYESLSKKIISKAKYNAMVYGDAYIFGDRPEKLITGCTKNFKPQKNIDMMETVFNIIDADKPDRNGMIWQRDLLMRQLMSEQIYLIPPRHHKSWMWSKFLEGQSYGKQLEMLSFDEFYMDTDLAYTIFLTGEERHKLQLNSIIHWNVQLTPVLCIPKIPRQLRCRNYNIYTKYAVKIKPGNEYYLKDLKVRKPVISSVYMMDYITETFGPVDAEFIRRVMKHNIELDDGVLPTPNLNDNKKALERVIKKARKRK